MIGFQQLRNTFNVSNQLIWFDLTRVYWPDTLPETNLRFLNLGIKVVLDRSIKDKLFYEIYYAVTLFLQETK